MDDPPLVGSGQPRAYLSRQLDRFVGREPADAAHDGCEILAIHILHGQEGNAFRFANIEDAAHIGVRDLPGNADFGMEASKRGSVLRKRYREEFDSDRLIKLEVFGAIDFAHAAATRQRNDAVALGDDLPWDEAAAGNWVRAR